MQLMQCITDFGDLSVLIPLSLLLCLLLLAGKSTIDAQAFLTLLCLCLGTMLLLKLLFLTCGVHWMPSVASPSGHTAMSTFVFGSIGLVLSTHSPRGCRVLIVVVSVSLIASIAVSRVYLGAHTIAEVVIGLVVGLIYLILYVVAYRQNSHRRINVAVMATGFLAIILVIHGSKAPAETQIRIWSKALNSAIASC